MILGIIGPAQVVFLLLILLLVGAVLTVFILYLLNLQNLLKQVGEARQLVPPANVWLMFIPLFNVIYPFILYPKICDSVKAEFEFRGIQESGDYGRAIGITMPILGLCGIIPFLGALASIANFILLIVFWVKMAGYKTILINSPSSAGVNSVGSSTDLLDS